MDAPPAGAAHAVAVSAMEHEGRDRDDGHEQEEVPEQHGPDLLRKHQAEEHGVDEHQQADRFNEADEHLLTGTMEVEGMRIQLGMLMEILEPARLGPWVIDPQGDEGEQPVHDENCEEVATLTREGKAFSRGQ